MKITRRKFLKAGSSIAALGAGAILLPQIAKGQLGDKGPAVAGMGHLGGWDSFNSISNFSRADFEGQIGTEFNLLSQTHGHRSVSLIAIRGTAARKAGGPECFRLVFKGSDWQDVNQDVYYVSHATLGYFYVLMAPVRESRKSAHLCYEAVINRMT